MPIPKEEWYSAIYKRGSRRKFNQKAIPEAMVESLKAFTCVLNNHIKGARAVVVTENPDEVFKGAVGTYGKIKGAPCYVAFIGNMKDSNVQEKTGYLGEYFILEATSLGLATCWVGGFFKPDAVKNHIKIDPEEKVLAVSPLGFVETTFSFEEKMLHGFAKSHKRKNLQSLLLSVPKDPLPRWISSALEAARVAPSAVNRQPWRFAVENDTIRILVDNDRDSYHISKRLDCGIAMAHIEIGAYHEGVKGQWELLKGSDVARYKQL